MSLPDSSSSSRRYEHYLLATMSSSLLRSLICDVSACILPPTMDRLQRNVVAGHIMGAFPYPLTVPATESFRLFGSALNEAMVRACKQQRYRDLPESSLWFATETMPAARLCSLPCVSTFVCSTLLLQLSTM